VGGFGELEEAERVLQEEKADIVVLGRALIADPQLPQRWWRGDPPRPCIRCNRCHIRIMEQKTIRCAVNPEAGREGEPVREAHPPKRIAVVGAGPAGITAALVASQRGHEVYLLERGNRIGGKLIAGSRPSFKRSLQRLLEFWEREIAASEVSLYLGITATPEFVATLEPDLVILATGGRPRPSPFPVDFEATQALQQPDLVGDKVLVIGAGMVGCELALYLRRLGKEVFLVDKLPEDRLMGDEHYFNRYILLEEVKRAGIVLHTGVEVELEGRKVKMPGMVREVDSVINATGFEADLALIQRYRETFGPEKVIAVGDLKKPGNIYTAVQEAYLLASVV